MTDAPTTPAPMTLEEAAECGEVLRECQRTDVGWRGFGTEFGPRLLAAARAQAARPPVDREAVRAIVSDAWDPDEAIAAILALIDPPVTS